MTSACKQTLATGKIQNYRLAIVPKDAFLLTKALKKIYEVTQNLILLIKTAALESNVQLVFFPFSKNVVHLYLLRKTKQDMKTNYLRDKKLYF